MGKDGDEPVTDEWLRGVGFTDHDGWRGRLLIEFPGYGPPSHSAGTGRFSW